MNKVNKGMLAIIIILVGIICLLAGYVMFDKIMATKKSSSDNKVSDNVNGSSNGDKMSYDDAVELDDIIGIRSNYKYSNSSRTHSLPSMLDKSSINDITNDEKLYLASRAIGEANYGKTFSKEELKKAYNSTPLASLDYTDDDIYISKEDGMRQYTFDKNTGIYTYNPYGPMDSFGLAYTSIAYVYDVDRYVKDGKYVVVNKYLFANSYVFLTNPTNPNAGITEEDYIKNGGTAFYGSYNDSKAGLEDNDKTASNSVGRENYYWQNNMGNVNYYALHNYDSIKDKLDTYTYTFERKDGHFVLTDFNVEHSK